MPIYSQLVEEKTGGIVLAAGGTGGHIFPAEALAEQLARAGTPTTLITDPRFSQYHGHFPGVNVYMIRAGGLRAGLINKLRAVVDIGIGVLQALLILKRLKPTAVIGFGGYPSFPTMYAASLLGIHTIVHEQNAILGRANRMLASKVDVIATSYPEVGLVPAEAKSKLVFTGNPVRSGVRALHETAYPALGADGELRVLVLGGSQGASIFSEVVPKAVALLPEDLRRRLRINQQCRKDDLDATRAAYADLGVEVEVASFFTDIPSRLASAHMVISRSGASSVSEITVAGRPSILVPLPTSADNHQYANAEAVEKAGGAWLMPQTGFSAEAVAARIESFLHLPDGLLEAAKAARSVAKVDAAESLCQLVQTLANNHGGATH